MEISQVQAMGQRQTQEMTLSHLQMQGLKLLQAPSQELTAELSQMLAANPVVELVQGNKALDYIGDPFSGRDQSKERELAAEMVERDESLADSLADQWTSDDQVDRELMQSWTGDDEERRRYFFDSLADKPSDYQVLTEQLREEAGGDAALVHAGEIVIDNLDDKGFLLATDQELAVASGEDMDTVQRAVRLVQSLKPTGIGSRTARECLLAQLAEAGEQDSLAWKIVDGYLDDLSRNRLPLIAKSLNVDLHDISDAVQRIRELEPFPGRALWTDTAQVIIPEATIYRGEDGQWKMRMDHSYYPEIVFNPEYTEMLRKKSTSSAVRDYLKKCIAEGHQFQKALRSRKTTLARITYVIMETQGDFFEFGPSKLRPMTRVELAEILELHETSVGRAVAGKYLMTPQGLFEYGYFFSTGYQRNPDGAGDDEEVSSRGIREKIRELVEFENPAKPLSDQKIAELLKQSGFMVARRTVAKYRELEGIQSSSLRRDHLG